MKHIRYLIRQNKTFSRVLSATCVSLLSYTLYVLVFDQEFDFSFLIIVPLVNLFFFWGYRREIDRGKKPEQDHNSFRE